MFETMKNKIDEKLLKESFLFTFLIGLIAHGYGLLNLIVSHDSLNDIYIASHEHKISIGRIWFPAYISATHGKLVLPWLSGMLAFCWIALSVYLVAELFQMKKTSLVLLLACVFTVNPTVISLVSTFQNDLDADMFALLLSVISAVLWRQSCKKETVLSKVKFLIPGAVLLSFTIGLYQSYISAAITLLVMLSMIDLIEGEKCRKVIEKGFAGIGMLVAAGGLYLCEIKLVTAVTGMGLKTGEYNSLGNMKNVLGDSLIGQVGKTYGKWVQSFVEAGFPYSEKVVTIVHLVLFAGVLFGFFMAMKKLELQEKLLFLTLAIVMPFGMNVCYLLSNGVMHDVMKFSFWFIYILAFLFYEILYKKGILSAKKKLIMEAVTVVCLAFLVFGWIQTSNALSMKKHLQSQATLSRMTRVSEMMDETEGYIPGETAVIFWGNNVGFKNSINGFYDQSRITGAEELATVTYQYTYETYFKYVLNLPIKVVYNKFHVVAEEIKDMPVFPKEGSVQMVEGFLVVKFE